MPRVDVAVSCPVHDSFRVQQVAGMFDVPLNERCTEQFSVELPESDEPWRIGLIVGASGSGKSTVAREAFGSRLFQKRPWHSDRSVLDGFGDLPARQIVELLTAVGFSSPPCWVKPYAALSNGQQMRCDLARALADGALQAGPSFRHRSEERPVVAFDEYTSVVDRNVAKACSTAIAKAVRSDRLPCRFVAITCHYDVAEWLEADWVLDMSVGQLTRRRLRRPSVRLEISRADLAAWRLFARHHYLSGSLHSAARGYLAVWEGEPVTFCATLPLVGRRRRRRFTRIVTLPDFQGMGLGMRVVGAVAQLHRDEGLRVHLTSSHPAVIGHCRKSPTWRTIGYRKAGQRRPGRGRYADYRSACGRAVVSFEYLGPRGGEACCQPNNNANSCR